MDTTVKNLPNEYYIHQLKSSHRLCYQLFGDIQGYPLLYCHGFPASRLEAGLAHQAASTLGACIVAVDRPGFGRSDFQPGRQMRDWVELSRGLMDALGHERFSVIGISGGTPYAMLLGEHLHQRIYRLGIVGGLGDLSTPGSEQSMGLAQRSMVRLARSYPQLALWLNRYPAAALVRRFPTTVLKILLGRAPAVDRIELAKPATSQIILDSIREAFVHGGRGPAWDFYLATGHWQADPAAIKVDTFLWHGCLDTTVPVSMGRRHTQLIPRCHAEFLENEGHFSLPLKHISRIISQLLPQ